MNLSPKAKEIKAKKNKWHLIKLVSFCTAKETTDKRKRQPIKCEKIFASDVTAKVLIYKIYNQLKQLKTKLMKKWAEDLNRYISKEEMQMANRYMKRYPTSLIIREKQIKTTMRFSPHTCQNGRRSANNKCW